MQALKQRCASARPLGIVKVDSEELLVVFDGTFHYTSPFQIVVVQPTYICFVFDLLTTTELGCYINRRGIPRRSSGYLRWETKATMYAHRSEHVLLFSPEFIEVRTVGTGRLVQVIEGEDIRLIHASDRMILVAMKGPQNTDKLVELIETTELTSLERLNSQAPGLWDEWDM